MTKHRANDTEILKQVAHQIDSEPRVGEGPIQIESREGVVVLKGAVEGPLAREAAEAAARRVPGVVDVANDLVLVPHGAQNRDDAEVAADVRRSLEEHAGVPHESLHCSITGGVVTLTGAVDRWCESAAAEEAINTVRGVRRLENLVEVSESVAPRKVHRAVMAALAKHAMEQANNLTITSFGNEVTITGVVACSTEKRVLLEAARQVPGVKSVKSVVRVSSIELVSPDDL
jgi:osmotically-inducible protein OsmY